MTKKGLEAKTKVLETYPHATCSRRHTSSVYWIFPTSDDTFDWNKLGKSTTENSAWIRAAWMMQYHLKQSFLRKLES